MSERTEDIIEIDEDGKVTAKGPQAARDLAGLRGDPMTDDTDLPATTAIYGVLQTLGLDLDHATAQALARWVTELERLAADRLQAMTRCARIWSTIATAATRH